jgi:hypothetical protein
LLRLLLLLLLLPLLLPPPPPPPPPLLRLAESALWPVPILELIWSHESYRQLVERLERGSAHPKATTYAGQHKHRNHADLHPFLECDSNPRSQCSRGRRLFLCLRPYGHCNRPIFVSIHLILSYVISSTQCPYVMLSSRCVSLIPVLLCLYNYRTLDLLIKHPNHQ